jgi:hypothetical protein
MRAFEVQQRRVHLILRQIGQALQQGFLGLLDGQRKVVGHQARLLLQCTQPGGRDLPPLDVQQPQHQRAGGQGGHQQHQPVQDDGARFQLVSSVTDRRCRFNRRSAAGRRG